MMEKCHVTAIPPDRMTHVKLSAKNKVGDRLTYSSEEGIKMCGGHKITTSRRNRLAIRDLSTE